MTKSHRGPLVAVLGIVWIGWLGSVASYAVANDTAAGMIEKLGVTRGICVVAGTPASQLVTDLAGTSDLLVYVQSEDADHVAKLRDSAHQTGLLGEKVFVEYGALTTLPLASNMVDGAAVVGVNDVDAAVVKELLRVLHPGARAVLGDRVVVKPRPDGADDWSHPYHGPDNNPQSRDQNVRGPYLTQFLTEPWYVPMPQVTVASGGRVFKALGHIALKRREWPWLNKLLAINAYNGTHLWQRDLKPGFMIHRGTLIATPELVYLADDTSCKLLDAATGELRREIVVPRDVDEAGVWKWMALQYGVLYALVGPKEPIDAVIRGKREVAGWPWGGLGDQYAGEYAWGFGRTLIALNPKTKKMLWRYSSTDAIDSRALCMAAGRIYVYSHQKYLASLDAATGDEVWRTSDPKLLEAIGAHDRAQTASKGYASSAYAKANEVGVYFAGPQRTRLVAVSAEDGSLLWQHPHGNFQLVLRDDGLYAMGRTVTSKVFDYRTGKMLADLECYRGNCTRATATPDSIFTRGYRHTGTMRLDLSSNAPPRRIPLMRPACQDGVLVSEGLLYWGPWMCDCNHSLVGMISLAPAGDFSFSAEAREAERRDVSPHATSAPALETTAADWPSYRRSASRDASSPVSVPTSIGKLWEFSSPSRSEPTAPVALGNIGCWSGLDGAVHAVNLETGKKLWTAFTGGAVRFSPEFYDGKVYVGSGDGYVYCLDAKSGRQIWRFRAAPAKRRIAVHGRLLSTWPVGSGVLVRDGVVYAAAGITSYDGTHVYALDAGTGKIRWQNNTSGRLVSQEEVTGISVQGHLLWHKDRLYMAGGNVVSPAIYDPRDGVCLNELENEWWSRPKDSKERFPRRPSGEMFKRSPRGRELFVVDGEVRVFDQLLYSPPAQGPSGYFGGHFLQVSSGDVAIRATAKRLVRLTGKKTEDGKPIVRWQSDLLRNPGALALCKNAVLVAGQSNDGASDDAEFVIAALDVADGRTLWKQALPAAPVSCGVAVSRRGRVVVSLVDGRVVCFGGAG